MRFNLNTHVTTTLLNRVGIKMYFFNSMLGEVPVSNSIQEIYPFWGYPSHADSSGKFRYIIHIRRRPFLSKYIRNPYTQILVFIHATTELLAASLNKPLVKKYNNEFKFLTKIHSPRMLQV